MKSHSLLVLACLISIPAFGQGLPDEINFGPYQARYTSLSSDTRAAEAKLSQSRASLAETRKYISDMQDRLTVLDNEIRNTQAQIGDLRREIPKLERYISELQADRSNTEAEIRRVQQQENQVQARYENSVQQLRPLQISLNRKNEQLRALLAEVEGLQRLEREAQAKLNREIADGQRIDKQILDEVETQRRLNTELQTIDQRIAGAKTEMQTVEGSVGTINTSLTAERTNLAGIEEAIASIQKELEDARTGNFPQRVSELEKRLAAALQNKDNSKATIVKLEGQLANVNTRLATLRNQIAEMEKSRTTIPTKIAASVAKAQQLSGDKAQNQVEINRAQGEANAAQRQREQKDAIAARFRDDVRADEVNVNRFEQLSKNLETELIDLRKTLANLSQRSREASSRIAETSESIQRDQNAIPRLIQDIKKDEAEINRGQAELVKAREDEGNILAAIDADSANLAQLTQARNDAQNEMNQRLNLYSRYEQEASQMGAGQAITGTGLGEKEGTRLANVLSKQNGVAVGRELGIAEAKFWGNARGEVQGFEDGYQQGLASAEVRAQATNEASAKAAQDAEIFAQTNLKPTFFEELVQSEFKKPMALRTVSLKTLKNISAKFNMAEVQENIEPLSASELQRSRDIKTQLDSLISDASKSVTIISNRARELSNAQTAFQTPEKIPFGSASCSQVYKGVAAFKKACDDAYKAAFQDNYIVAAKGTFTNEYSNKFQNEFNLANVAQRETSYPAELASAAKIGNAEGVKVGRAEAFEETYERIYADAYRSESVKAKDKAKADATRELDGFLKQKPLLTLAGTNLTATNFRGGEEVSVMAKVKNVSQVPLNGPVVIRVTDSVNAQATNGQVVVNEALPLTITSLPALKVRVSNTAKGGEQLIVRGTIDLPGDLYHPIRQEKFELIQVLSLNPAHQLNLDVDKNPDIKGVFGRKEHEMTVTLSPTVENVPEGYTVALTPQGEASSLMDMKSNNSVATGSLKLNAGRIIKFKYKFQDASKGKNLQLALTISYAGKVIKQENIVVTPK